MSSAAKKNTDATNYSECAVQDLDNKVSQTSLSRRKEMMSAALEMAYQCWNHCPVVPSTSHCGAITSKKSKAYC